jgi:hypothetical protein
LSRGGEGKKREERRELWAGISLVVFGCKHVDYGQRRGGGRNPRQTVWLLTLLSFAHLYIYRTLECFQAIDTFMQGLLVS